MDEEVKQAIDKLHQDINNGDKEALITLGGILFYEMVVEEFYKHTNKKWVNYVKHN
jgi:prefoldin subunit 5